jgi:outer membrane protein
MKLKKIVYLMGVCIGLNSVAFYSTAADLDASGRPKEIAPATSFVTDTLQPMVHSVTEFDPFGTLDMISDVPQLPGDDAAASCPAEVVIPKPLGLSDAVDLALCNKPSIRMAAADIRTQAAGLGQATGAFFPTFNLSMARQRSRSLSSFTRTSSVTFANTVNASMSWKIFDFGGRLAQYSASHNLLLAAFASQNAEAQRIISEVVQSYFSVVAARATWESKKVVRQIADNTLTVTKRKSLSGAAASNSDVLQATAAVSRAVLEEVRALGAYQKSLAVLVQAMGLTVPSSSLVLPEKINEGGRQEIVDLNNLIKEVSLTHPTIVAAKAKYLSAQDKMIAAAASGLPSIDLNANMYRNGRLGQALSLDNSKEVTASVVLTIPLFEGLSGLYRAREARADAERKQSELREAEQNVMTELVKTHADAESALNNLGASKALIDTSNDALLSVSRRYDKGATDIIEMLNAQRAFADAQQERVNSLAEWWAARLRLLASMGRINRSTFTGLAVDK